MTIAMPDSIYPLNIPNGTVWPAVLGYVDGHWPTAVSLKARFPHSHVVTLTVLGGSAVADGCDIEPGNLTPASGAAWIHGRLAAGAHRPIAYASAGMMGSVLAELGTRGVQRSQVRLLSAHYGAGEHICGPATCKLTSVPMDGTQWTDNYPGAGGAAIDMSALDDNFFGAPAPQPPTTTVEVDVKLQVLRQGDSGQAVRNWQGLLVGHAYGYMIAPASGGDVMQRAGVDGVFGANTAAATKKFQEDRHLTPTGVVGAQEWTAALS